MKLTAYKNRFRRLRRRGLPDRILGTLIYTAFTITVILAILQMFSDKYPILHFLSDKY